MMRPLLFRNGRIDMSKMKKEDIDRMIMESVLETESSDILSKFSENLHNLNASLEKNKENVNGQTTILLSSIMTAQVNAVNIMRNVLYKICYEDGTQGGTGGKHVFNKEG